MRLQNDLLLFISFKDTKELDDSCSNSMWMDTVELTQLEQKSSRLSLLSESSLLVGSLDGKNLQRKQYILKFCFAGNVSRPILAEWLFVHVVISLGLILNCNGSVRRVIREIIELSHQ